METTIIGFRVYGLEVTLVFWDVGFRVCLFGL